MPGRSQLLRRRPSLTIGAIVPLVLVLMAPTALAGPGFHDASADLVERPRKTPADPAGGGADTARQVVPRRSPRPAALRRAKAEAAGSPGPGLKAPAPRAAVFSGLNKPGMLADALSGTPPDATGAIGPNHYVEFVNSVGITAYNRNLDPVSGPVALEDFIGFPADSVFDPQIQWDQGWGRWIYAMDDIEGPEDNWLAFGWSKTADPSNLTTEFPGEGAGAGWCGYFIYTGALFDDYPKLGHSDSGITIGTNVFEGGFLGSRLWSIAKPTAPETCPVLDEGAIASTGALFTEDGDLAFTPVPANTGDSSPNSYVVAADFPEISGDAQVMAWHIVGAGTGATLVEDGNIGVSPFEIPANVPQPGTAEVIDSSDTRLTNAVAIVDPDVGQEAVWTQHTVDGPGGRSVVRWYELLPATQAARQEGTISDPGHFVFNAAISPSTQGNSAAIHFNRGSATLFPDMHARSRHAGTALGTMVNDVLLGTSAGAAVDFSCDVFFEDPCRWGDYAGASPDHSVPGLVWGSNQGLAAPIGEQARWTTRNFALVVDETAPPPPILVSDPPSPVNQNNPALKGSAEAGSTVRLYRSGNCSGAVEAQGGAGTLESPGFTVVVADNTTTQFTATATDAVGNTSACSATLSYVEVTPSIARASGRVTVRRGRALVRLRCPGPGPCRGAFRLFARVQVRGSRGAHAARKRVVAISRVRRFSLAAGRSRVVRVRLTRVGKRLMRRAGPRGRRATLRGRGVRNRSVVLRNARRRR